MMSQIPEATNASSEVNPSSSPELDPKSDDSLDNKIELTSLPSYHSQRSHSSPSVTYEDHSDPQSVIENFSDDDETSNPRTVFRSSPSNHSEQNDSIESLNSSLPIKQPRIDHRRNKSEPVKSLSNDDLQSPHRKSSHIDEKTSLTSSRKKKAWYNPFQSTYRQRNDEFRKIFKDLPADERLVVDYSCAWQKDILAQGRMYLSANYLCFYANILNWKSSLCLKYEDIVCVTREKTAKLISNAIEVKTNKSEKYFFASFVTRDKTFLIIERLWKAIHLNQPIPPQQLWVIIHENYGDDLDMTTDDEDEHHRKSKSPMTDRIISKIDDEQSSISSQDDQPSDEESLQQSTENIERSFLRECPCQSHLATQLINRTYSMSVERLLDCLFGQNDFLIAFRNARRIKDYQGEQWHVNPSTGKRERSCSYKVTVTAVFGSSIVCSNERQIIENEQPNSYYIIDTEVRNEGIKYSDAFYIASRYCLVQIEPNKSHLKVTCEVRFVKSVMAIIKTFIEKNALAALQDSYTDLMKRMDQESVKQSRLSNRMNEQDSIESTNQNRQIQSEQNMISSSINEFSCNTTSFINDQISKSDLVETDSKNTFLVIFCIITTLLLLIVNIFLCIKLNQIDQMTDHLIHHSPSWLHRYSYEQDENQWTSLLKTQEEYYQTKLINLQSVLTTTHNALKNVTDALNQLSHWNSRST